MTSRKAYSSVFLLNAIAFSYLDFLKAQNADSFVRYGFDVSYPIHYENVSTNYPWLSHNSDPIAWESTPPPYWGMPIAVVGDRASFYEEFMVGCRERHGEESCKQSEENRMERNRIQPSAVVNYTDVGYAKIRTPPLLFQTIQDFWNNNRHFPDTESWDASVSFTNHWNVSTDMIPIQNISLRGGGQTFCLKIWDAVKDIISEWTGQELAYSSIYGIRIYKENAVLAPHVDRLPLVLSAIINVDQDVDEPWPLEVYSRDGFAVNITMIPGEMVLYESHSIIHGRPFPLRGRFMANLFVHFEPVGPKGTPYDPTLEQSSGLPPYISPNSDVAKEWLETYTEPRKPRVTSYTVGSSYAHYAAKEGSLDQLIQEYEKNRNVIHEFDADGYTPLHWAVQREHLPLVQFLISKGADRDVASRDSNRATSLWWARSLHSASHPIAQFLRRIGALDIGPEL